MQTLDWILCLLPLVIVVAVGIYAQRYVKSVADFLSANRSARRYLLAIAGGELQAGAVGFVGAFEVISHAGYTLTWWGWLSIPVGIIVTISGFVTYRYRETRAMTLAQFFEIRYSKSFRLFAGVLGFLAGILNFGIIPSIGARCLVYFLGPARDGAGLFPAVADLHPPYGPFPDDHAGRRAFGRRHHRHGHQLPIEGIMSQLFYLMIIFTLLAMFDWRQISDALGNRPAGQSMLNPFDSTGIQDFNIWNILMSLGIAIYGIMAWQNSSAYNSAPLTPHEGRMGAVLSRWREMGKLAVVGAHGRVRVHLPASSRFRRGRGPGPGDGAAHLRSPGARADGSTGGARASFADRHPGPALRDPAHGAFSAAMRPTFTPGDRS